MSTDLAEQPTEGEQPQASPTSPDEPDDSGKGGKHKGRLRRAFTYDFAGIAVAFIFAWLSFTPSLIPRSALFQGLVAGVAAVIGYVVGLGIRWVVVQFTDRSPSDAIWRRLWIGLWVVGLIGTIIAIALGEMWQTELRDLMGQTDQALPAYGLSVVLAVVVFVLFIGIGRVVRDIYRWIMHLLQKVLPVKIAKGLAFVVVALAVVALVNDVIVAKALTVMDQVFATTNRESYPDTGEPTSSTVSGGPSSTVTWASLGRTGRDYVAGTPTAGQIEDFSGTEAMDPIRAYAGLESSDDPRVRSQIAVDELQALGGFEREVLVIGNSTGSGWVDDQALWPLEFMYDGDTAAIATQYSYLPSWLSFLVDKSRAQDSGRALFDAVYGVWSELPPQERPKLVVFGESLGSFGGETAFSGADDMANRTNGIVFMGPPADNRLAHEFTKGRDDGSPMWQPIFENGETVRYIAEDEDIDSLPSDWEDPRVMYIQHASDPISWWTPDLLFSEPDWLQEAPGPDRSDAMRWFPLVTFFQVSADLAVANSVPDGHGHKFGLISVDAWAEVLPPPGWTESDSDALATYLDENPPNPLD